MTGFIIENGVLSFNDDCDSIDEKQFKGNESIRKIVIGKNIKKIGAEAFSNCTNLEEIIVDDNDKYICAKKTNAIVEKDSGVLIVGCYKTVIDDSVNEIAPFAFCGQSKLKEVTIPKTCKKIDSYAFDGCNKLVKVIMEDGVEEIHDLAFRGCYSIENITFPKTLKMVSNSAFGLTFDTDCGMILDDGCSKIKNITFTGLRKDFRNVTNFNKIFLIENCLSYSDVKINCVDGEIVLSNTDIDC